MIDPAALLSAHGRRRYGEAVTQLEHALQCAALAAEAGADEELLLAALLHDLGHLTGSGRREAPGRHHGQVGAALVRAFVPARVAWLIEHHVLAKRYLCTVDPIYAAKLSGASRRSLARQGGLLPPAERVVLEGHPWLADVLRLRRWDDQAKSPGARVPPLSTWRPLLAQYFPAA